MPDRVYNVRLAHTKMTAQIVLVLLVNQIRMHLQGVLKAHSVSVTAGFLERMLDLAQNVGLTHIKMLMAMVFVILVNNTPLQLHLKDKQSAPVTLGTRERIVMKTQFVIRVCLSMPKINASRVHCNTVRKS